MPKARYAIAVAILAVTFAGGWVAALTFQSPEQREAAARPPAPGPIVASVTTGRLADEITVRADINRKSRHGLLLSAVPDRATVTSVVAERGKPVGPGTVLLTLNGRPLFVLPGSFDFYRDLSPGLAGVDVEQLQAGLEQAGHDIPEYEIGSFGPATEQAVEDLYEAAGFEPILRQREPAATTTSPKPSAPPRSRPPVPIVPLTEVTVAPRLPAVLASAPAVGARAEPDRALATVDTGPLVARATVVVQAAVRLERGMSVELSTDDGKAAEAIVTSISTEQSSSPSVSDDPAIAASEPVVLITPRSPLPGAWAGKNVLARITIGARSKEALLVPSRAVTGGPDGEAAVLKQRLDGTFARVRVRELATLAGRSAVEPVEPGSLAQGDKVRVG